MVPAIYTTFFTTMAAAGATLFGLIFVAISIAPENITNTTVSEGRQIRAAAAYIALLNPLMISLFALVPYQLLGIAVTVFSWIGILNTLALSIALFQSADPWNSKVRSLLLIIISFILYCFEAYIAIQLDRPVIQSYWFSILADVLIIITLFGIIRAWELIGIRRFRIRDWFVEIISRKNKHLKNRVSENEVDEDKIKK